MMLLVSTLLHTSVPHFFLPASRHLLQYHHVSSGSMMIINVSCIDHLLVDSLDEAGALVGLGQRLLGAGTFFVCWCARTGC